VGGPLFTACPSGGPAVNCKLQLKSDEPFLLNSKKLQKGGGCRGIDIFKLSAKLSEGGDINGG
jgi:hypothetical protein